MTADTRPHTVLADADGTAYASLRKRPRRAPSGTRWAGRCASRCRARPLGDWEPPADRPDPVQLIMESHEGRLDGLIPVRVGRMVASPYGFLRGTAVVMAEDVAAPAGHRHHPGHLRRRAPGQLRLLRLARARPGDRPQRLRRGPSRAAGSGTCAGWWPASGWPGGRTAPARTQCATRCRRASPAYRERGRATSPTSRCWPARSSGSTSTGCTRPPPTSRCGHEIERAAKRARHRTSDRALPRFTERGTRAGAGSSRSRR